MANMKPMMTVILVLFSFLVMSQSQKTGGFRDVVLGLEKFGHISGGFKNTWDSSASLDATSSALFLSTLYGLKNINSADVQRYLSTVQNLDYGFANRAGLASDLESVRNALLAYANLGVNVPNSANVASYITSLYDKKSNLFSNRAGEKADLKSTAFALQSLNLLKAMDKVNAASIKEALSKQVKDTKEGKFFNSVGENYYGILAASFVAFDFGDVSKWSNYILSLQSKDGGFYADNAKSTRSVESTANAVSSLYILQKSNKGSTNVLSGVNVEALRNFLGRIPNDLKSAAQAHLAITLATGFPAVDAAITYESTEGRGISGDRVVQGTHLKPSFTATSFESKIVNSGYEVEMTVTLAKNAPKTSKLTFNDDARKYVTDDVIDTNQQLGELAVTVTAKVVVAEIGDVKITLSDKKTVGYGVNVAAEAVVAGKKIPERATIGIGAELNFGVALYNQTNDKLISGDFDLVFSVLDSSLVTIYTQSVDCRTNTNPITFSYTLKQSNVPAGELTCRFEAKNKDTVHSRKDVLYNLAIPMVATEINFEGVTTKDTPSYKIGDTLKVSMVPASFPDLKTVYTYPTKDAQSKDVLKKRNFFMDISTTGGVVLLSVPGTPVDADGKSKYVFTQPVEATLDFVGTHVVSFRYAPANKRDIALSNYDSTYGELSDESSSLNFVVNAELEMVDVEESPKDGDVSYGNDVSFKFKLRDRVSKKNVLGTAHSNVYLTLKHQQPGKTRTFVSATQPASHFADSTGNAAGFKIKWAVNPNAVSGAGVIGVSAQDADGVSIPIYKEGKKDEVQYKVKIGGKIDAQWNFFATEDLHYDEAAFILQFNLTCQSRRLKDAQLRCVVLRNDTTAEELFTLPVATNADGQYEVSWTVPHKSVKSGDYIFQFFREVDKSEDSKPLFTVSVSHQAPALSPLPFRTEFIVVLVLGGIFFAINQKKSKFSY